MYDNDDRDRRSSHYYSYGPYSSRRDNDAEGGESTNNSEVEMVPPRSVKPYYSSTTVRKSVFGSRFWSFIFGALIVGGLMFAADATNLFSSDEQPLAPIEDVGYEEQGSDVQTASVNTLNNNSSATNSGGVIRPANIADIVDRTNNAVVKIETTVKKNSMFENPLFNDPLFERFFGDDFGGGGGEQNGGMGSGFIFDKTGYILTNEHVIEGADKIFVKLEGSDKKYPAKLLGTAYNLDLAVLKIEGNKNFPALKMGNSEQAKVGDWVIAIGNPYGFEHTVTVGVLSAKERPISIPDSKGTRDYKNLLQTDASINPGNSGGPLLNLKGEVIGINTAVSAQAQGIGFAIPTSTVNGVLDALKKNTKVVKAYMGVRLMDIDKSWVSELGLSNTEGSAIMQVESGSPAAKGGLEPYDVVVSVNGKKVKNTKELQDAIQAKKPGERINMVIVRDGKRWSASLTLGKIEMGIGK
jgi:S1-C subfamily serine protease